LGKGIDTVGISKRKFGNVACGGKKNGFNERSIGDKEGRICSGWEGGVSDKQFGDRGGWGGRMGQGGGVGVVIQL